MSMHLGFNALEETLVYNTSPYKDKKGLFQKLDEVVDDQCSDMIFYHSNLFEALELLMRYLGDYSLGNLTVTHQTGHEPTDHLVNREILPELRRFAKSDADYTHLVQQVASWLLAKSGLVFAGRKQRSEMPTIPPIPPEGVRVELHLE